MFYDCLYGKISLDIPKAVISAPEVQRLRSIRLCNINSPYLTGGSDLNRFEHAIGTAFLGQSILDKISLNKVERTSFLYASLLHDIVTAPFGHSLEYLFEAFGKTEYEHANLETYFESGTRPDSRPVYFNRKSTLPHVIGDSRTLHKVITILKEEEETSKFLSNNIDIDNIDNVYRFAYHLGIKFDRHTPLKLAKALQYKDNKLCITDETKDLFQDWYDIRAELYKHLLENEGEFASKALLERAFIQCVKAGILDEWDWILTDYQMLDKLMRFGDKVAVESIVRLMHMDFPKITFIAESNQCEKLDAFLKENKISIIEESYKDGVYIHFIRDVNKTHRVIEYCNENNFSGEIGKRKDRYLIGFFSESKRIAEEWIAFFDTQINCPLTIINRDEDANNQISLF